MLASKIVLLVVMQEHVIFETQMKTTLLIKGLIEMFVCDPHKN